MQGQFRKGDRKRTEMMMEIAQKKNKDFLHRKRIYEGSTPDPNDKRRSLKKLN